MKIISSDIFRDFINIFSSYITFVLYIYFYLQASENWFATISLERFFYLIEAQ